MGEEVKEKEEEQGKEGGDRIERKKRSGERQNRGEQIRAEHTVNKILNPLIRCFICNALYI